MNAVRKPSRTQIRIREVPLLKTLFIPLIQEGFNGRVKSLVVFGDYNAAGLVCEPCSVVE